MKLRVPRRSQMSLAAIIDARLRALDRHYIPPAHNLLSESDPALAALAARERTQRVRDLSATELDELDF